MGNTYSVLYKTGGRQIVKGTIVLFSSINTDVSRPDDAVYLNADEVMSIIKVDPNAKTTDE